MHDTDFTAARTIMVDSQVRPNKVNDRRILDAMKALPRERFVPPHAAALAYADEDVPLGGGRVLLEPMVIARLVQAAAVVPGERVLVVASGTGYGAALMAACGGVVTALEDDKALLAIARSALAGHSVTIAEGAPAAGWASGGPYDVVFLEGAAEQIPEALAAQVKQAGGRFIGITSTDGRTAQAVSGMRAGAGLALRPLFDCATPRLPGFRQAAGFVF